MTTVSKGHDAPACAAIASDLVCETALTFNAPEKYAEDIGKEIAEGLGYKNIVLKNAHQYLNNTNLVKAEFVSSGELGTWIVFSAFEKEILDKFFWRKWR